jgi:release factor glutamine methyltransferase
MPFVRPPGVYAPQEDTRLLEAAVRGVRLPAGARALDVCCGSGALALAALAAGAGEVVVADTSVRALLTARANAALRRRRLTSVRGDVARAPLDGAFALVLANPPYVPSPPRRRRLRRGARVWDGGPDGRAVLDPLCRRVPGLLAPEGTLLLVHSAVSGAGRSEAMLREAGLKTAVVGRRTVPFGPVMRAQAAWLEERALIAPGQRTEELVVIRADRT